MAERKKFVDVEVPILNTSMRALGTPTELNNKTIKLDLTRRLRGKGLTLTLRIFNKEGKLFGVPSRMELVKSYIKRIMRKRVDYVEDSFKVQCADISATIKPFLITRKKVSRAVRKNLRNTTKEFLIEYVKERDFNEICFELKNGALQKAMLPKLKKVYPLAFCDIRIFETKEIEKIDLEKATNNSDSSEDDFNEEVEENLRGGDSDDEDSEESDSEDEEEK